jgi:hypothetical protein
MTVEFRRDDVVQPRATMTPEQRKDAIDRACQHVLRYRGGPKASAKLRAELEPASDAYVGARVESMLERAEQDRRDTAKEQKRAGIARKVREKAWANQCRTDAAGDYPPGFTREGTISLLSRAGVIGDGLNVDALTDGWLISALTAYQLACAQAAAAPDADDVQAGQPMEPPPMPPMEAALYPRADQIDAAVTDADRRLAEHRVRWAQGQLDYDHQLAAETRDVARHRLETERRRSNRS